MKVEIKRAGVVAWAKSLVGAFGKRPSKELRDMPTAQFVDNCNKFIGFCWEIVGEDGTPAKVVRETTSYRELLKVAKKVLELLGEVDEG